MTSIIDRLRYYDYVAASMTWVQAESYASGLTYENPVGCIYSGHLTTITSADEEAFIDAHFGFNDGWLGGSEVSYLVWAWVVGPEAGQVFWDHGTTVTYANWGEDPGDPSEQCLFKQDFNQDGLWSDRTCSDTHGFFVEYRLAVPTGVPMPAAVTNHWGTVKQLFR